MQFYFRRACTSALTMGTRLVQLATPLPLRSDYSGYAPAGWEGRYIVTTAKLDYKPNHSQFVSSFNSCRVP